MSAVRYNGYLIVAVAKREHFAGPWHVCVDVSCSDRDLPSNWFEIRPEFDTQAQAENCGLNLARTWIDQQLADRRELDAHRPAPSENQTAEFRARNARAPVTVLSSAKGNVRAEVREFAERIEAILRQHEKKKKGSWTDSGLEALVHDVLDNTSALLMTNYNDESQKALLPQACFDLATLAFLISRKSLPKSKRKLRPAQNDEQRNFQVHAADGKHGSVPQKRQRNRAAVRALRPKHPSLTER
jgi:hypothetical protein